MWSHQENSVVLTRDNIDLLTFCLDPKEAKTFLHPVRAPGQKTVLTDCYPADHIWHRGVWWSWKYINGVNYWEESPEHKSQGLTRHDAVNVNIQNDQAVIEQELTFLPPGQEPVMEEKRRIEADASDSNLLRISYTHTFTALQDCILNATPVEGEPNGVWYGGYAGFSVRRAQETKPWAHLDSVGRNTEASVLGQTADWMSVGGDIPEGQASLTILQHPENPRHPSKWYAFGEILPYFSPALLMGGALIMKAGETLTCRYRLLVSNTVLASEQIDSEYNTYKA